MSIENTLVDVSLHLTNDWIGKNISDEVASIATQNLKDNGFFFIEETGLYYDSNQNCYYCPQSKLYYYVDLEEYYFYDEGSESLKLYSSSSTADTKIKTEEIISEYAEPGSEEELEAPCLRMVVMYSGSAEVVVGTSFVVTCYGASLGREGPHLEISLPDELISKFHSKVHYSVFRGKFNYKIEDVGSKNGTYLDGVKIEPGVLVPLEHGSKITVGSTRLLCHIHRMYQGCLECSLTTSTEKQTVNKQTTLFEKYKYELSCLKNKYGFRNFITIRIPGEYLDRAKERRFSKGSFSHYEKTDASSIDIPIRQDNKGYVLLKKMGWMEDQALGKSIQE